MKAPRAKFYFIPSPNHCQNPAPPFVRYILNETILPSTRKIGPTTLTSSSLPTINPGAQFKEDPHPIPDKNNKRIIPYGGAAPGL